MSAGIGQLRESRCGARPAEGAERPEQGGLRFDPRGLWRLRGGAQSRPAKRRAAVSRQCEEGSGGGGRGEEFRRNGKRLRRA